MDHVEKKFANVNLAEDDNPVQKKGAEEIIPETPLNLHDKYI